jgi:hypothetical protein
MESGPNAAGVVMIATNNGNSVTIIIREATGGALIDNAFYFIAAGPSNL